MGCYMKIDKYIKRSPRLLVLSTFNPLEYFPIGCPGYDLTSFLVCRLINEVSKRKHPSSIHDILWSDTICMNESLEILVCLNGE